MDATTTALLRGIRRRGSIPRTQATGSLDEDLLAMATNELQLMLVADIRSTREEYFEDTEDVALEAQVSRYRIPTRALGGSLRRVWLIDSQGKSTPLDKVEPDDIDALEDNNGGTPCRYWLESNSVVVHPTPASASHSLRMLFERRPSALVPVANVMAITGTLPTAAPWTYTGNLPNGITTSSRIDVVQAQPHYDFVATDLLPTAVSAGTSITFAAELEGVAVGDFVCFAGESPVPQVPQEFHAVLEQMTACQWLRNNSQGERLMMQEKQLAAMREALGILIDPRVIGEVATLEGSELFGG